VSSLSEPAHAYVPNRPTKLISSRESVFFMNCSFRRCSAKRGGLQAG
jgi:hypothetical protein